ncbi:MULTISPECIES: hypothetical protein [unclassified Ruegeria]|uniref:hypothetical protein n=1 Tax=unclassified Ruegeria TaxID=2625375 RepID=UPI0014886442|nr:MULTISPECIES: hypothetical protein [unclassified Ruegeria]NOD62341.1 hypothetical protein [Ruegeria sp. HKCCD6109]
MIEGGNAADTIDLQPLHSNAPTLGQGAKSAHHNVFAVVNRASQLRIRQALLDAGYQVTLVIRREPFEQRIRQKDRQTERYEQGRQTSTPKYPVQDARLQTPPKAKHNRGGDARRQKKKQPKQRDQE